MKLQTLPHTDPIDFSLRLLQNTPFISVNFNHILQKYNSAIDLTTKGDFAGALDVFR